MERRVHSPRERGEGWTLKHCLGAIVVEGHVSLVCLRLGIGSAEVVAAQSIPLPEGTDEETVFQQKLTAFLIAGRIPAGVRVTLGVPRSEFFMRRFETPPVKPRNLSALVGFEMDRHLPGRREDFLCGWRVEGRTADGGHGVLLGAVRKLAVERPAALLRRANLGPHSIQPETFALAGLLGRVSHERRDALVIDLGRTAVGIDFIRNERPEFSLIIPVSDPQWRGPHDDSTGPGADRSAGTPADAQRQAAAQRLGSLLADRLASPLFRESLPGGELPELRIGGYGANRSHLVDKLQNELRLPVRAFSPWPLVRWGSPPDDLSPYTSALALAFAAAGKGKGLELDPDRQEELHRAPSLRLSAVLAVLLVAVLAAYLGAHGLRQQRQLALADDEIRTLKAQMTRVEGVNRRVQEQRSRLAYLTATVRGRARLPEILRELTGLLPDGVYLTDLTFNDQKVEITGLAPSASQLVPVIEASPLFMDVEFSDQIRAQGAGLERFRIRMLLETGRG